MLETTFPDAQSFDAVKRTYDRDGFLILRRCLQGASLASLREHSEQVARRIFARLRAAGQKFDKFGDTLKRIEEDDPWFGQLLRAGPQMPLLRALVGDEVVPGTAAWFDRPHGSTQRIMPHVDGIVRKRGPHTGATMWIALDDANTSNGCLHYRRGSHLVAYGEDRPIPGPDEDPEQVVPLVVEAGDCVIHNALTVHWSGENHSGRPRRALTFFYWGASSEPTKAEREREARRKAGIAQPA